MVGGDYARAAPSRATGIDEPFSGIARRTVGAHPDGVATGMPLAHAFHPAPVVAGRVVDAKAPQAAGA